MAKPFSINFLFQDKTYSALVSLRQHRNDLQCIVRYPDKDLHPILPGDSFIFSLGEGMKQPRQLTNYLAESLVSSTAEAITNHLQGEENY